MGRYKKKEIFGKLGGATAPWPRDSRGAAGPGAGAPARARAASSASAAAPRSSCSLKTSKAKEKGVKMSKVLPKIGGGSSRELWRCHPMDLFVVCWLGSEVLQEISNLFEKRSQIQEKGEHRGKEHPEERCVTGNWNLPCPDTGICASTGFLG